MATKQSIGYKVHLNSAQANKGFESLNDRALKVAGSFAAAAGVVGGIGLALNKAMDAAKAAADSQARLNAIINATGQKGKFNTDRILELSGSISSLTGASRSQVTAGSAMLLSFGLNDEALAKLMPSMADAAAFMGADMSQAAQQMGKAINTGYGALTRIGITMSDTQKKAFNAAKGMDRVNLLAEVMDQNVGGAAEALNQANFGFNNVENAMNELLVPIGQLLNSGLNGFWKELTKSIRGAKIWLDEFLDPFNTMATRGAEVDELAAAQGRLGEKLSKHKATLERLNELRATGVKHSSDIIAMTLANSGIAQRQNETLEQAVDRVSGKIQSTQAAMRRLMGQTKKVSDLGAFARGSAKGTEDSANSSTTKKTAREMALSMDQIEKLRENDEIDYESYLILKNELFDLYENELERKTLGLNKKQFKQLQKVRKIELEGIRQKQKEKVAAAEDSWQIGLNLAQQNKAIAEEEKQFGEKIEQEKADAILKINNDLRSKQKEAAEIALQEEQARVQAGVNALENSAGIAIGIAQQLANDIATGQENAAERALASSLMQYGGQLVGLGTKAAFEGGVMVAGGNIPQGAALLAAGGAAIAAGVGMGAAGAAVNASISGTSGFSASNGVSPTGGEIGTSASASNVGSTSDSKPSDPEKQNITIISNAPIFGDIRPTMNSWAKAQRKAAKFSLRTV